MTSRRVSRFIGASKASYLTCALGMILLSAFAFYIAAFEPFEGTSEFRSYEEAGWVAGPLGVLFFGYCFYRGMRARTDGDGRILNAEGKPLAEE
jgi:hypothetical protein